MKYSIQTLNKISKAGTDRFCDAYTISDDAKDPDSNEYYREAARAEQTITYEQAEALHRYMKANNIYIKGWLNYHGKGQLRELTPQEYDQAIAEIERKQYRKR